MIQHPSDETELAQCDDSEEEENARRTRRNPRDVIQSPFNRPGREMTLSTLTINMESIRIDKKPAVALLPNRHDICDMASYHHCSSCFSGYESCSGTYLRFTYICSSKDYSYYLASPRELIRIYGTTKAPVMNYAAETSLGVVTIRAFGTVDRFFKNYLNLVVADDVLSFCLMQPWSGFSYVGLSLSYALALTQTQVFITRWYCTLSNSIISVERIKQYMSIPAEPPAVVDDKRPPSSWPSNGTIHLQELKIRYRPTAPLVLVGYGPDPPKRPT
ncbi:hypothetical protein DY000_02049452 [Brassica cretica]|uniref:ABC transmembrane type-1 domain-containing protein n=1 Tax=Brassica cretica TaxID=69181 RepID=A0ABQ7F181_BRACR|nr:hypothetical protein DY000_02049452 [Brassica cretica]